MSGNCDPSLVRYPPESLLESINTASVPTTGTNVAEYSDFEPMKIEVEKLVAERGTSLETEVTTDSTLKYKIHNEADTNIRTGEEPNRVSAWETISIDQKATGVGAESNISVRYNLTVRNPTIVDKIRSRRELTEAEQIIATELDVVNRESAGLLPRHNDLLGADILRTFDEIIPVDVRLDQISAGGTGNIGPAIRVPDRDVYVLLGLAIDGPAIQTAVGGNDTYIVVDRDSDTNYIKVDASTMPGLAANDVAHTARLYVPAKRSLRVYVKSATGLTSGIRARYFYGRRKVNDIDYYSWGLQRPTRADREAQDARVESMGINKMVLAGMME